MTSPAPFDASPDARGAFWRLAAWYTVAIGAVAAGPWMAVLLTHRGWSPAAAASLLTVFPVGRMVGGSLWGLAADRLGARRVLRWIAVGAAGVSVAMLVWSGPWVTVAWLVVLSLVRTPAFPIVDAESVARLGPRYGTVRAFGSASFLVIGVGNGLLAGAAPELPFVVAAVLSVLAVGATESLPALRPTPPRGAATGDRAWWSEPALVWLFAVATLHGAGLAVYDQLFVLHVEALGMPAWVQSLAVATGVGTEVAVLLAAPWLGARFTPWTLLIAATATGVPRFVFSGLATAPGTLGGLQVLHGVHFGLFWIATTQLFAQQARPEWRNTIQTLLPTSAFGLGPIFGLLVCSALLARKHETPALLFAAAGVSAVATGVAVAARWAITRRESRCRRPA